MNAYQSIREYKSASKARAVLTALQSSEHGKRLIRNADAAPGFRVISRARTVELIYYGDMDPASREIVEEIIDSIFVGASAETDHLRKDIDDLQRADQAWLEDHRTDFELEEVNPTDMELIQRVSSRIGFCDSVLIMLDIEGDVVMHSETIHHIRSSVSGMLKAESRRYNAHKQAFNVAR